MAPTAAPDYVPMPFMHKIGFTLLAISNGCLGIAWMQPKMNDPAKSNSERQFWQGALIFILILMFGLLKNFVWATKWQDKATAAEEPAASTPATTPGKKEEAKEEQSDGVATRSAARRRTPKA